MNTISILWDACLREDFENTSFVKVPPCNGVYFNNICGHAGDTISCTTSFMTGYDVFGHGISHLYNLLMDGGNSPYPKARAFPTLPMLLQMRGINTFLVGEDPLWLSLGYDWIADFSAVGLDVTGDLKKLKSNFIAELDEPFFVHLHLWSAHLRGKINDINVETFDDKKASVVHLDAYLRMFLNQLWSFYPETQVVIWSDHGDTVNKDGEMRHAGFLHPDVQGVWSLYLNPKSSNFRLDQKLHAQADLFRVVTDTYSIEDDENIPRYAINPLSTCRDAVYAANWMKDEVIRYPDECCDTVDNMMNNDSGFLNHIKVYGHLMPVNHPPPNSNDDWPHEKVTERLKALGYIE